MILYAKAFGAPMYKTLKGIFPVYVKLTAVVETSSELSHLTNKSYHF